MSAEAVGWVYRHSPYAGATFQVHSAIADSVNDQNDNEFWLPLRRLAEKARTRPSTAKVARDQLLADGFIAELQTPSPGRGNVGRYRFLFPDVPVVYDTRNVRSPNISPEPNVRSAAPNVRSAAPGSDPPHLDLKQPKGTQDTRPRALPEDWAPSSELREWAAKSFPAADLELETQSFRDHYRFNGKPGKDWDAAWRNWIRNTLKFSKQRPGQMRMTNEEALQEAMRRDGLL